MKFADGAAPFARTMPRRYFERAWETMSRDELRQAQWARFRGLLGDAWERNPFYQRKLTAAGLQLGDIREPADLRLVPVTGRTSFVSAIFHRRRRFATREPADGVILLGAADPELTAWQLEWIERGARSAGRRLDDVFVDLWLAISVADDERQAREDVRAVAASQARWCHHWKQRPPLLERFSADFARAAAAYEFLDHLSRHARHRGTVSDELTDFVALAGSADRCSERIRRLLERKVDRISFALLSGGRMERIAELGTRLLPRLVSATR